MLGSPSISIMPLSLILNSPLSLVIESEINITFVIVITCSFLQVKNFSSSFLSEFHNFQCLIDSRSPLLRVILENRRTAVEIVNQIHPFVYI